MKHRYKSRFSIQLKVILGKKPTAIYKNFFYEFFNNISTLEQYYFDQAENFITDFYTNIESIRVSSSL